MKLSDLEIGFELEFGSDLRKSRIKRAIKLLFPEPPASRRPRDNWFVKVDGSVRDCGTFDHVEVVTPVWPWHVGMKKLAILFDFMTLIGAVTNRSCGIHINIGFINRENSKKVDTLALCMLVDELKWLKTFRRTTNEYCVPVRHRAVRQWRDVVYYCKRFNSAPTRTFDTILSELCMSKWHQEKYDAINRRKLEKRGYVEFRMCGNTNYHKKYDLVKQAATEFGMAMINSTRGRSAHVMAEIEKLRQEARVA